MIVEIIKSSKTTSWYAGLEGLKYDVEETDENYSLKEDLIQDPGCVRFIRKEDCKIVCE